MAFRFVLDSLLRLRRSQARQERLRMEILSRRVAAITAEQAQLQNLKIAESDRLARELKYGLRGAELQAHAAGTKLFAKAETELAANRIQTEASHGQQRGVYRQAKQNQDILEKLRENQLADYSQLLARHEQARVDELFLIRRHQRR